MSDAQEEFSSEESKSNAAVRRLSQKRRQSGDSKLSSSGNKPRTNSEESGGEPRSDDNCDLATEIKRAEDLSSKGSIDDGLAVEEERIET